MKNYLFYILVLLVFPACKQDKQDTPPENLLPEPQMAHILIDLHVQQAALAIENLPPDSAKKVSKNLHQQILEKHEVSDSTFRKSYNYYAESGQLEDIYEVVVDSLGVMETESVHENQLPPPAPAS